jgi:adenylate cyclase
MASRNGMNFEDRTYALSIVMNQDFFKELSTWLTEAGLAGAPETSIVSGFCDRCVAAGLPLARSLMFIDTLHPIHEGRLF